MKLAIACFMLMLTLLGLAPAWGAAGPVPVPRSGGRLPGAAAVAPALPGEVLRPCLAPAPGVSALGEVSSPPPARRPAAVPAPAARQMPRPVRLGLALRVLRRALAPPGGGVAQDGRIEVVGWLALAFGLASGIAFFGGIFFFPLLFLWPLLCIAAVVAGIIGIVKYDGTTQTLSIIGLVLGALGLLLLGLTVWILVSIF